MHANHQARQLTQTKQVGFTYLGVMFAVALIGIGLTAISEVWTKRSDREKIAQVNWIGQQYVNAIGSYYYANTGSVHFYPNSIEDLLEDKRYLSIKRHLRSSYDWPIGSTKPAIKLLIGAEGGAKGAEISVQLSDSSFSRQFIFISRMVPCPTLINPLEHEPIAILC